MAPEETVTPAVASVAEALAGLALADDPPGPVSEVAGPAVEQLVDMVTCLAARRSDPVQILAVADTAPTGNPSPPGRSCPAPTPPSSDRRFKNGSTPANACHRLSCQGTRHERPVPALRPAKA